MKFLHNIENFFQKHIEGFFDKTLGSGIQPVEIAKQLVRHMDKECSVGISHVYVPNRYIIHLATADYNRLGAYKQTLENELAHHVKQQAARKEYTIVGHPEIELRLNQLVKTGQLKLESEFCEYRKTDIGEGESTSETRVFSRIPDQPVKARLGIEGMITVLEGLDVGHKADITVHRVNLGRRESNEMPLTDMNTSRLHCYILFEDGGHVLYDAKSLNGTYVNDHRVTRKRLKDGDHIKVGNTVLLYEVK